MMRIVSTRVFKEGLLINTEFIIKVTTVPVSGFITLSLIKFTSLVLYSKWK